MSEYGEGDDTLDETTAANNSANNSIIGKVRTSVTSILPNSLSKWFSPSTNKSDLPSNGNKRRRNEGDISTPTLPQRRILVNNYDDEDEGLENDLEVEESNVGNNTESLSNFVQPRRSLNTSLNDEPPPVKRSRMTFDGSMINSRPLVASTPAVNLPRSMSTNHYGPFGTGTTRTPNRREPGYNFYAATAGSTGFEPQNTNTDIIDILIPMSTGSNETVPETNNQSAKMEPTGSRRNLNIPQSSIAPTYSSSIGVGVLKRQSLSSVKGNSHANRQQQSTENNNTLTSNINAYEDKDAPILLDPALELDEAVFQAQAPYNGQVQSKFQNGNGDEFAEEVEYRQSSPPTDSDVEEIDAIAALPAKRSRHLAAGPLRTDATSTSKQQQRAAPTGLFNMSMTSSVNNSRNGSRTSSFGNGLNFDTHLEGRKSLFAGGNGSRTNAKNSLGNSTLSLNSLSRRQFNASIYGSTSALSDSRLLNATTSPFYKGNTTYGGAAAYQKYPTATRLTPTMMRPLSSLSTLSSSNNSLAGERATAGGGPSGGTSSAPVLSGSAKYIFDALNEMTTPILDAKKMASSLQQRQQAAKSNESHNAASSAGIVRLQQVSKPYMRPTVMLRPKHTQQNQPPPIRELQVPSMSQLLTMKKQFQNSTERSRQIAMQKAISQTYAIQPSAPTGISSSTSTKTATTAPTSTAALKSTALPTSNQVFNLPTSTPSVSTTADAVFNAKKSIPFSEVAKEFESKQHQQQQQKHVNKIRHKINTTRSAPDCVENEPSLLPVDLPQIMFPVMKEMPKIDIGLPPVSTSPPTPIAVQPKPVAATPKTISFDAPAQSNFNAAFKFSPPARIVDAPQAASLVPASMNFKFCDPVSLKTTQNVLKADAPLLPMTTNTAAPSVPPLRTGSVLDALKSKPAVVKATSFGDQFKKTAGEWECDSCMLRNQPTAQKCVACETQRKAVAPATSSATTTASNLASGGFGNLFKKQAGEWECDACMLRNKLEATKCVSCETARKTNDGTAMAKSTAPTNAVADTGFKAIVAAQTSSSWECDDCMTRNDATRQKCACCEKAKPGAAVPPSFTTGSAAGAPKADDDFKAIAAKQADAKWECEACMAWNESARTKCVCCEHAKPGNANGSQQLESSAPKFSFGTTAAAKFSFGFGAGNESELRAKTTTSTITPSTTSVAKTESATGGFTFGIPQTSVSTTASKGFSFGLQGGQTAGKDSSDGATKPKGFTFGLAAPIATATTTTTNGNTTTTSTTAVDTISTPATKTTTTSATASVLPFSFGATTNTVAITTNTAAIAPVNASSTATSNPLSLSNNKAVFSFGTLPTQKTADSTVNTTVTTTASSINTFSGGQQAFSFGLKAATTATTTASSAALPSFNAAINSKPLLAFGTTSTTALPTSSLGGAAATKSGFGSGTGFSFPTPAKPIFGQASSTTTTTLTATTTTAATTTATTFGAFGSPKIANLQKENSNSTTTTAATPFGGFSFGAAKSENNQTNLFGLAPAGVQDSQVKPVASATPIFGSTTATNQTSQNATTTSTPLAAAATWPNSTPSLFGSSAQSPETAPNAAFGTFNSNSSSSSATPNATSSTSIFGSAASGTTPAFGSNNVATVAAFGMPAVSNNNNNGMTSSTTNLFGSTSATGNAASTTALPQFGSANTAAAPTFGSSSSTFGGFGTATAQQQPGNSSNTNTQANVATPFQFGAQATNTTGFNFGANATSRPAFNFTANSQQPSFNFTGSATESNQNASRPFQFGAPAATAFGNPAGSSTSSMVFNFGGAQTAAECNAPFQFSAGNPTQTTTNIFAPTASSSAQSSAAARRRVRLPTRRLTPR